VVEQPKGATDAINCRKVNDENHVEDPSHGDLDGYRCSISTRGVETVTD
jgi:hypothetical protein